MTTHIVTLAWAEVICHKWLVVGDPKEKLFMAQQNLNIAIL